MTFRAIEVILAIASFGLIFIVAGLKRMFIGGPNGRNSESLLWGTIGLLIGVAMIGAAVWIVFGTPPPS